jgi:hypothetical protein
MGGPARGFGEARVLRPDNALVTTEAYAPWTQRSSIRSTSVSSPSSTSKGRHSDRAVLELDLLSCEARERLARVAFAIRAALDRPARR